MTEKLGFCLAMCYLCKHNHKVNSVRLHVKEEAAAFSFLFLYRSQKPCKQGYLREFPRYLDELSRYETVHNILCYDSFHSMLRCKCYCVVIQMLLSPEVVVFQLRINKTALDKNSNKAHRHIECSGSSYNGVYLSFLHKKRCVHFHLQYRHRL